MNTFEFVGLIWEIHASIAETARDGLEHHPAAAGIGKHHKPLLSDKASSRPVQQIVKLERPHGIGRFAATHCSSPGWYRWNGTGLPRGR